MEALNLAKPSQRLERAIAAGDVVNLFPVLKDWSTEELQALLEDVVRFSEACDGMINAEWKNVALRPETFFSAAMARRIDKERDDAKMVVFGALSEISSVAIHYLEERGVEIKVGDEE